MTATYSSDNWDYFVKKLIQFLSYRHIIYNSITNWNYFQNISDPLGQPFLRKNWKKTKKALFARDEHTLLKSPEEINTFLRIRNFWSVPYIPLVKWIHFHPCYSSLKSFCEGEKMRNSQKWEKFLFLKKLENKGYYLASRSLLNY